MLGARGHGNGGRCLSERRLQLGLGRLGGRHPPGQLLGRRLQLLGLHLELGCLVLELPVREIELARPRLE